MGAPYTLDNVLRIHDEAIVSWVETLHVDYGDANGLLTTPKNNVPCLWRFSAPHRMYAELVDLLVSKNWVTGSTADLMRTAASKFEVLPLPFVTITRGDPQPDMELGGVAKQFRVSQLLANGSYRILPYPKNYRCDYTLDFWCHSRFTEAHIREWLASQFGGVGAGPQERFLFVSHGAPVGKIRQSLKITGVADQSVLESADDPRWIRFSVTVSLRMLFFTPSITDVPIIFGAPVRNGQTVHESPNLFFNPTVYETFGNAVVTTDPLTFNLTDSADAVRVGDYLTMLSGGVGVLGTSFRYRSTATTTLRISTRANDTADLHCVNALTLPASPLDWQLVHIFTYVDELQFTVDFAGAGSTATLTVDRMDFRDVYLTDEPIPMSFVQGTDGAEDQWQLSGDRQTAYLVMGTVRHWGSRAMLTLENDGSPVATRTQTLGQNVNRGFVLMTQPASSLLNLKFDSLSSTTLANPFGHKYYGAWNGHTI